MLHHASPPVNLPVRFSRKTMSLGSLIGILLIVGRLSVVLSQEEPDVAVARVSSGAELQAALEDPAIVHVVVTADINLVKSTEQPSADIVLPMRVSGTTKTIRGACPPAKDADDSQSGMVPPSDQQCVISARHSLFTVSAESPGDVARVWMHNLYVRLHGAGASVFDGSDDSAAIMLSGSQAWLTSVTVVGLKASARALTLAGTDLYVADSTFEGLALESHSAGALLQSSTASLQRCTFENITGPDPCAVMRVADSALLLRQTTLSRGLQPEGAVAVCGTSAESQVFADAALAVLNLEDDTRMSPHTVDSVAASTSTFLTPSDPAFTQLLQGHVQSTGLPLPEALRVSRAQAVPESSGSSGGSGGGGDGSMAIVITGACVAVVAAAVLAVVAWMLLQRGRSRNLEPSDNLSKDEPASGDMSSSSVLDSHKTPMRRQASTRSLKSAAQSQSAAGGGAGSESFLQIGDVHNGDASSFASQPLAGPPGDTSGSRGSAPSTPAGRGARRMVRSHSVGGAFSSWAGNAHTLSAPSRPQSARCSSSAAAAAAASAAAAAFAASGASVPLCSTVASPNAAAAAMLPGAPPVQLATQRRKPAYWHSLHALQSYETSQSDILPRSHSAQVLCLDRTDSSTTSSIGGVGGGGGGMRRLSSVQHAELGGNQVEFGSVGGVYRPVRYVPGMPGTRVASSGYGGLPQPRSVGEMQRFSSAEGSLSGSLDVGGLDSGRGRTWGLRGGVVPPRLGKHVEGTAAEERGLALDLAEMSGEVPPGAGRTDIAEMVMSASVGGRSSVHSGKVKYLDELGGMPERPQLGWSPGPTMAVLLSPSGRGTESKPLDNPLVDTEEEDAVAQVLAPGGRTAGTTVMIEREMQLDGSTAVVDGATGTTLHIAANPHRLETV
eukprot:jgi/Ulvmu1/670/UM010_0042.1